MWGAIHCYLALKAKGQADHNYLVMGPWRHSQVNYDGYNLGPLKWEGDTATAVPPRRAEAVLRSVSEDGRRQGRHAAGVHLQHRRESLGPPEELAARLRNRLRRAAEAALSRSRLRPGIRQAGRRPAMPPIPTSPIPRSRCPICRARCASPTPTAGSTWLVTDQRSVADRTDVLTYETPVLTAPVRISGAPVADLFAATTGTDADWVVKLIDVYPGRRSRASPRWAAISWRFRWTFSAAATARASSIPRPIPGRQAAAIPLRAADDESRIRAGPSHHGADPVELVPAVRPQSADLRPEHLLRQAGGLCEGDAVGVPRRRTSRARYGCRWCRKGEHWTSSHKRSGAPVQLARGA